jgi:hypothetical protein
MSSSYSKFKEDKQSENQKKSDMQNRDLPFLPFEFQLEIKSGGDASSAFVQRICVFPLHGRLIVLFLDRRTRWPKSSIPSLYILFGMFVLLASLKFMLPDIIAF